MLASVSHSWEEIKVEALSKEEEILCKKCLLPIRPSETQEKLGPFLFHRDCYQSHLRYLDIINHSRQNGMKTDVCPHGNISRISR
jgi:hypothetical protein